MIDFNLPPIKKTQTRKRILSMDEYLAFVQFNIEHAFDKDSYDKWKKMSVVNEPFRLD